MVTHLFGDALLEGGDQRLDAQGGLDGTVHFQGEDDDDELLSVSSMVDDLQREARFYYNGERETVYKRWTKFCFCSVLY